MRCRAPVELRVAEDGAEALAMARGWVPDVLVLDAHLPGMSGFDVLRELRRLPGLADAPGVHVFGRRMPEDVQRAYEAGFVGYWTKPIDIASVLADIDHAADSGEPARRLPPPPDSAGRPRQADNHVASPGPNGAPAFMSFCSRTRPDAGPAGRPTRPPSCCATSARPTRRPRPRCAATWPSSWRPARGRDPAPAVVADPARHHPAHAARPVGREVRQHLDRRRLAADRSGPSGRRSCSPATSANAATASSCATRCATATRRIARGARRTAADGATRVLVLPLYPQYCRRHHRQRRRRGVGWSLRTRALPELRFVNQLPRRPGLHRRAGAAASPEHWQTHGRPEKAGDELPRHARAHI